MTGAKPMRALERFKCVARRRADRRRSGFTLIEVLLAIFITVGMLVVVLYFYQQAAHLRTQLLVEADRLSTIRLLLDRLATDLRTARSDFSLGLGLTGDATSLEFIATRVPSQRAWKNAASGRAVQAETDLHRITYAAATTSLVETNPEISGFTRYEEPLAESRQIEDIIDDEFGTLLGEETRPAAAEPLTDLIRFVQFRYWDGSSWVASWDSSDLPAGVEIRFGGEPLPEDVLPEDYPYEVFRRVVYLPGSSANFDSVTLMELLDELTGPDETEGAEAAPPAEEPAETP